MAWHGVAHVSASLVTVTSHGSHGAHGSRTRMESNQLGWTITLKRLDFEPTGTSLHGQGLGAFPRPTRGAGNRLEGSRWSGREEGKGRNGPAEGTVFNVDLPPPTNSNIRIELALLVFSSPLTSSIIITTNTRRKTWLLCQARVADRSLAWPGPWAE